MLMSWTKIVLADELLASDLPDDPYLDVDLRAYFPEPMQEGFARRDPRAPAAPRDHRDPGRQRPGQRRRHDVRARGSPGETGATAAELTRANFVAREIFGSLPLRHELQDAGTTRSTPQVQTRMRIQMRTLVERASRWLVTNRRPPLDSQATVDHFREPVQALMAQLPDLMTGREREDLEAGATRSSSGACRRTSRPGSRSSTRRTPARHRRDRRADGLDPAEVARRPLRARRAARPADRWCAGSSRCRARTAGRRWPAPPCATTLRRAQPAHRAGARGDLRRDRPRPGSRLGGDRRSSPSAARPPRSRRSAATRRPTWRGCRSGCGSSARCWGSTTLAR